MVDDILLIGPIGAGKSTVAELLSKELYLQHIMLDMLRWDYYAEIGFDQQKADRLYNEGGFWSKYAYWKPFEAYAVERALSEYSNCIFDFGGGHSVYEDGPLFDHVAELLKPYQNVILILPCPSIQESLQILDERDPELKKIVPSVNAHFLTHHSNYDLAKHVVYTMGKCPAQTCSETLNVIGHPAD